MNGELSRDSLTASARANDHMTGVGRKWLQRVRQEPVGGDGYSLRSTPFMTTPRIRAVSLPAARTSSWARASPVIPAAGLVIEENPRHRIPRARAATTSGTVDIPTASAPR